MVKALGQGKPPSWPALPMGSGVQTWEGLFITPHLALALLSKLVVMYATSCSPSLGAPRLGAQSGSSSLDRPGQE